MRTDRTHVLIVGAGPTGLALALSLQQSGIDHMLIERRIEPQTTSRAAVIHAHTMEVLERIGMADDLSALGLKLDRFSARDRDRALLRLRFDRLPSRYPYLLMLQQNVTEARMAERLIALGGRVHRGVALDRFHPADDGVRATITTPDGPAEVRARFIIGGDGMHSVVREGARIAFDGDTYGQSFMLADIRADWPLGASEVSMFFAPGGLVVYAPLPDGQYRVVATVDEAPEVPGVPDVQAVLDARGPRTGVRVNEVIWGSRFRVHHRLASAYRAGPALLMGDAAHVHSPAGGQGMNCGLIDAIVLGELLADVLKGRRPETDLAHYERLRRPAARQVLTLAHRLTRMATTRSGAARVVRNLGFRAFDRLPPAKTRLIHNLTGLSRRPLSALPPIAGATAGGAALPQAS